MNMQQVPVWRGAATGGYRTYEVPRQESQSVFDNLQTLPPSSFPLNASQAGGRAKSVLAVPDLKPDIWID
jgi:hypothetical protein